MLFMRMLTPEKQGSGAPRTFDRNERQVRGQLIQLSRPVPGAPAELERGRQNDRIDALKIMIRTLLDQLDYFTEPAASTDGPDLSLQAMVRRFEAELIRHALLRTGGRQRQAARLLGEKKTTLNAKIIRYGIRVGTRELESSATGGGAELRISDRVS